DKTLLQKVLIGIPSILLNGYASYLISVVITYQFIYFQIICYYLVLRLKCLNTFIIQTIRSDSKCYNYLTCKILSLLNSCHLEIYRINKNMWSEFLLLYIINSTTSINLLLFSLIFGEVAIMFKISFLFI